MLIYYNYFVQLKRRIRYLRGIRYVYLSLIFLTGIYTEGVSQNPFASINNFNVFAQNNVVMSGGDVEGGIAAGGNFTVSGSAQITANNAGAGNTYGTVSGVNYGLVVNGNIIYTSGQFNVNANGSNHWLRIGNLNGGSLTLSGSNLRVQNGTPFIQANNTNQGTGTVVGSGLMNYSSIMTTMSQFSTGYAGCANNITPTFDVGNPTTPKLTLAANTRNVWNITGATLAGYTGGITFNNQPTQTQPLIINVNVTGTFNWTVPNMNGIGRTEGRYIIWNFYNVSTLNIVGGQTVEGAILAPSASIVKSHSANIEGQIVCVNYTQTAGEVHVAHFDATPATCCSNITAAGSIGSNQSTCLSSFTPATFTETGAPSGGSGTLEYQWQNSPDNTTWTDISGATSQTYTSGARSATTYFRRGARRQGCSSYLYSSSVSVTFNTPATISASNTGPFCTGGTVQLNSSINLGLGTVSWTGPSSYSASGQNVTRGSVTTAMSGTYNVSYTAPNGCTASSSTTVTINASPSITTQPTGFTACIGSTQTVAVVATNAASYQWQSSPNNSTWTNISGATGVNYPAISTGAGTTYYRVIVNANAGCTNATSNSATVVIVNDPSVSVSGGGTNICSGGSANLTANVSNGTGTTTYQWESSPNNATWTAIGGATNSTYNPTGITGTTYYRVIATQTGNGCGSATSASVVVTVFADPTVNVTGTTTLCSGSSTTLTANITAGTGTPTYTWQQWNGSTWNNVGSNSNTYGTGALSSSTQYRVSVTMSGVGCDPNISTGTTVTVNPVPSVTAGSNSPVLVGNTINLTATTGNSGASFNWTGPNSFSSSTQNPSITNASTLMGGTYNVTITLAGCTGTSSTNVTINTAIPPTITTQPTGFTECIGGTQTVSVAASGTAPLSYQWQSSPDNSTWTNIGGATAATHTPSSTGAGTTYYRCVVTNAGGSATSNSATVIVVADPSVSISGATTICSGGTATLTSTVSNGTGTTNYQWQSSPDGSTWTNIGSATSANYTTVALSSTTHYRVNITQTGNGCNAASSNSQIITVVADPSVSISGGTSVCSGTTVTLTSNVTGGNGTNSFQWQSSPDNSTWSNISGATSASYPAPNSTSGTTFYRLVVTQTGVGCGNTSSSVTVTINSQPSITNYNSRANQRISFASGKTGTVVDYNATDSDIPAQTLTFSISGGADAARFTINGSTGILTFNTPPQYATPIDANGDNIYITQITVSDGTCTDVQTLRVEIGRISQPDQPTNPPDIDDPVLGTTLSGIEYTRGRLWLVAKNSIPAVYAVDTLTGTTTQTITIGGATNVSWTDIATDEWFLYIADVGNATNGARTDLKIYKIDLDDIPASGDATIPSANVQVINFTYDQQIQPPTAVAANSTRFDCEAILVRNSVIHLFTKDWTSAGTGYRSEQYVLPTDAGTYQAKRYAEYTNMGGFVTGADNAGPRQVLLTGYDNQTEDMNYIWTFYNFTGDAVFGGTYEKYPIGDVLTWSNVEGICFGTSNRNGFVLNRTVGSVIAKGFTFQSEMFVPDSALEGTAGEGSVQGQMRYNAVRNRLEYFDGLYWRPMYR
jgi:choice-of-anchor A domain-containing protein